MDNRVKLHACKYAVIRFVPFSETEEFVNIGVILACPTLNFFDFKLQQKRRHARVTDFFSDVGRDVYKEALEMFSQELSRVQGIIHTQEPKSADQIRKLFDALIHPREALIQFSSQRVRMAADPKDMLKTLFSYYVERNFVTPEYKEQVLERRVRTLVHGLKLPAPFRALELGDEFTAAHFPLVQQVNSIPVKAIKPFFLGQSDPSKIISHGGFWVDRIRRMRARNLLPKDILFAVEGPAPNDGKRYSAFREICEDFNSLEIKIAPSNAEHEIVDFAEREIPDGKLNLSEPFEVTYWTSEFGITRDQLEKAIEKVGPSTQKLRNFFDHKLI